METTWTPSEAAGHVRAELETIASSLPLRELARLLELGRKLVEERADATAAND
ncbi:MAG TPA: hypothetical protein VGI39_46080 [Polyangiaceae bacterium]